MKDVLEHFLKRNYLRLKHINKKIYFAPGTNISVSSIFEGYNHIGKGTSFTGRLGRHTYVGENCVINAHIGRYTSIGSNVVVIHGIHPTQKFVSTSPVFYSTKKQTGKTYVTENQFHETITVDGTDNNCVIGNDVWIGYGVTIMPGIKIGDGAVIAANATATRDVQPYDIVGGCPAKSIKKRFSDIEIEHLLNIKWWEWSETEVENNSDLFCNIKSFLERYYVQK